EPVAGAEDLNEAGGVLAAGQEDPHLAGLDEIQVAGGRVGLIHHRRRRHIELLRIEFGVAQQVGNAGRGRSRGVLYIGHTTPPPRWATQGTRGTRETRAVLAMDTASWTALGPTCPTGSS